MYLQMENIPVKEAPRRICPDCGETAIAQLTQRYHTFDSVVGSILYECASCKKSFALSIPVRHYINSGNPKYAKKPSIFKRLKNFLTE